MNRARLRRIMILLIAAVICLVMARFSRPQSGDAGMLTVWFSREDLPASSMEELLERCGQRTGLHFEAHCFENEQALGAAFDSDRPDLLFCGQTRAVRLSGLSALPEPLEVPPPLAGVEPAVGQSFFPLGARLPLLLVNTDLAGISFTSMEELLGKREGFVVTDAPADMLYAQMCSVGARMQGNAEDDRDADYRALYNRLALAVFHGTLVPVERDAAEYVRQGVVPCAVVPSTELAGLSGEKLRVRALPLPENGSVVFPAELFGFALMEGADTRGASLFLRWLWSEDGGEAAYASGLVPAAAARDASGSGGLAETLSSLAQSGKLSLPAPDDSFYPNRAACARRLLEALDLLA